MKTKLLIAFNTQTFLIFNHNPGTEQKINSTFIKAVVISGLKPNSPFLKCNV